MRYKRILFGFLVAALSTSASATLVMTSSLQDGLDALTDGSFYNVNTGQTAPDEVFQIQSSISSANVLIFEFAGFEDNSSFGIYDISDTTKRLEIFDGSIDGTAEGGGASAIATLINFGTNFAVGAMNIDFASTRYGYYVDSRCGSLDTACDPDNVDPYNTNGGGLFFSQAHQNTDGPSSVEHGETQDHMVTYRGDGALEMDITGGTDYRTFGTNEYILAWEDLAFDTGSDYDYSDLVVLVESVEIVPEPATLAVLGLGLLGLGIARGRRKTL